MSDNCKKDWSRVLRRDKKKEEKKPPMKTSEEQIPPKAMSQGMTERERRHSRRCAKEREERKKTSLQDAVTEKQSATGSGAAKSASQQSDSVPASDALAITKADRKRKRPRRYDQSPESKQPEESKKKKAQVVLPEKDLETGLKDTVEENTTPLVGSSPVCVHGKKAECPLPDENEENDNIPSTSTGIVHIKEEKSTEMTPSNDAAVKPNVPEKNASNDERNATSNQQTSQRSDPVNDGKDYELSGYSVKFLKSFMYLKRALETKRSNVERLAKMNDEAELLSKQNQVKLKTRRDGESSSDDEASQNSFGSLPSLSQYFCQQYESVILSVKKTNQQMVRFINEITDEMGKKPLPCQSLLDRSYLRAASENMVKNCQGDLTNENLLNLIKQVVAMFFAISHFDQENNNGIEVLNTLRDCIQELRSSLFEGNAARLDIIVGHFSKNPYFKFH